jgi:hypothetical protein
MRTEPLILALWLPLSAAACGFCIEDRVAAVYDQATVEKAVKEKRYVAFFSIEGEAHAVSPDAIARAVEGAGAIRGATRVSIHEHALAAVYDPKHTTLERLGTDAGKSLAARGVSLTALRVIDASGRLTEPAR